MLLREIERYLKLTGMAATSFGRAVAGDPRLVHDMRRGREPGERMSRRITSFIGQPQ